MLKRSRQLLRATRASAALAQQKVAGRASRHQPVVLAQIALQLALGGVERTDARLPRQPERSPEPGIPEEPEGLGLKLLRISEQEPRDPVLDERAIPLEVGGQDGRSEEHTSELQSQFHL